MTVKTFIDRPILAGVISVLIVILGVIGLVAAAISAAKARFRPIIMTTATMIFGMLALLFVVPVLFVVFQYLHEKISVRGKVVKRQ